jgi:hypothetical protein
LNVCKSNHPSYFFSKVWSIVAFLSKTANFIEWY